MTKANFYRIYSEDTNIDHDYLLEGDDVYLLQMEIKKVFENTTNEGRIDINSKEIEMISELEGEYEHYSEDEISKAARKSIPHEFEDIGGNFYMLSDIILSTLEKSGVKSFKAYPIHLSHKYTGKSWYYYWYVTFTYFQHIPLLTGEELCFCDAEFFGVYFAESVINNIKKTKVKNLIFKKHEFPLCQSVPMSSIDNVSNHVLSDLEQLFIHKKPRVSKDSFYSIEYFLPKLKEKYSDINTPKIIEIIENDKNHTFETEDNESMRVKYGTLLYKKLFD